MVTHISIQSLQKPPSADRKERRRWLLKFFRGLELPQGSVIHEDTLSVAGQTVDAMIPPEAFDAVSGLDDIRVDKMIDRQVVPG